MASDSRKKGRPSLDELLHRLDEEVALLPSGIGGRGPDGLPGGEQARELWIDEVHHSTALEGNTLTRAQVAEVIGSGTTPGQAKLSDSLDVRGYAVAVDWVREHAVPPVQVPFATVSELHRMALGPVWSVEPPPTRDVAGSPRTSGVSVGTVKVSLPSAIRADLSDWSRSVARVRAHPVKHAAIHHAWFERIHPFIDGNGRVGRLILNLMLGQSGYPRVVIEWSDRSRYLRALRSADEHENPAPLTELVARAGLRSTAMLLQEQLTGEARLVPLSVLASEAGFTPAHLRQLVLKSRLRAVRRGRNYLSSRAWLSAYLDGRDPRGRRGE